MYFCIVYVWISLQPIMLLFFIYYAMLQRSWNLPIMLNIMLKIKNFAQSIIVFIIMQVCMNKSPYIAENFTILLECVYKWYQIHYASALVA